MLLPWHKVYDEHHLTPEGWRPATIPFQEFFHDQVRRFGVVLDAENYSSARVIVTRKLKYPLWKEWVPFTIYDVKETVATVRGLSDQVLMVQVDGVVSLTKSTDLTLTDAEAQELEADVTKLPKSLIRRIQAMISLAPKRAAI